MAPALPTCAECNVLCAGIGRSHWDGHTVAFSSPQRGLQKTETKGGRVLWLYVDPINRDDMLAMGAALFQVRFILDAAAFPRRI